MFPIIYDEMIARTKCSFKPIIVWDAPLLFKAKLHHIVALDDESRLIDEIWSVVVSDFLAIERAKNRWGKDIEVRLKQQISIKEQVELSDRIIWNDTTFENLKIQVIDLYEKTPYRQIHKFITSQKDLDPELAHDLYSNRWELYET